MNEHLNPAGHINQPTNRPALPNRQTPFSEAFTRFIAQDWDPYPVELPAALPASGPAAIRRQAIASMFPGDRLVVPAGTLKTRNNDCDYAFRPDSAFAHLTGLGTDREPNAVLVIEATGGQAMATLYFKPRAPRTDPEFYADSTYGEMWVGQRESLDEMSAMTGIACAPIDQLEDALASDPGSRRLRVMRDTDPAVTEMIDRLRASVDTDADTELAVALSEYRLVKDPFEIDQLRAACAATAQGFEAVVRALPAGVAKGRGERWVEGVFDLYARHLGNDVGYGTIAASGDHANTLHWVRNDGDLREGELLLMDAGIEVNSLYTADVTRTLPISGKFSDAQREVYEAVLEAQRAGIAAAQVGATFAAVHRAAIEVIARHLEAWGVLPVSADEALSEHGGQHRRWMVHGTSHHLGLDVHDCARARNEHYRLGTLREGMVITVEPGIYFKSTDQRVPERFKGIGVRIEDDIVITADGPVILSDGLPRDPDELEAWMAPLLAQGRACL